MEIVKRKISELMLDPANVRKHSDRNIETIKASLIQFSQQKPIVIDKNGLVRAGNGTLEAARALGWEEIACVVTDLEGVALTAYGIADNRTTDLSAFDEDALYAQLESLFTHDQKMLFATGFDPADLERFKVGDGEMPSLSSGDREPFQQMTFTLHDEQVAKVKAAMEKAKARGIAVDKNQNSNGNALAAMAEAYLAG